jgi:hypothetical protein
MSQTWSRGPKTPSAPTSAPAGLNPIAKAINGVKFGVITLLSLVLAIVLMANNQVGLGLVCLVAMTVLGWLGWRSVQ